MNKSNVKIDTLLEFSLCAFIFVLPFSKSMVEIFFVLALIFWAVKRIACHASHGLSLKLFRPVRTKLNLPVYFFVLISLISTVASASLILSLKGFTFKLLEWVSIYFIVVESVDTRTKLNRILMWMFASVVIVILDGIFQYATGTDFIRRYYIGVDGSIQGPFVNKNSFAGWLVVMIPIALSFIYVKSIKKPVSLVLFCALIPCLLLTRSEGALIAALFSAITFAVIKDKKLLVVIAVGLLVSCLIFPTFVKERICSVIGAANPYDIRATFWKEAAGIIEDYPLFGCGVNTYAKVGPYYKVPGGGGAYPHNSYLQMAAEIGLLGLGAFLWIIFALFKTALANLKRIETGPYGAILTGLLAGLAGYLIHSFVDVNIYTLQLGNLMWFIIGLAIACNKINEGQAHLVV